MQTMFIPTLAWVEGVIVVLAIVLTAGGWIVNVVKKVNEAAAARKARQAEKEQALRQQFQLGGADRLPERGVEARASVNPQLDLQPDNLTAAQRAARDRARAAYQRRAELLAKQRQTQQPGAARASSGVQAQQSSSSSSSSARQQQAQAARQAQRARQQAAQRQEQVRLAQARQQAQQRAAVAREAAVREARRASAIEPPMEVEEVGEPQRISRSNMETGAGKRESTSGIDAGALRNALGGRSLRAAFVLKEVLDRPVGLRPQQDQPGMGTYI